MGKRRGRSKRYRYGPFKTSEFWHLKKAPRKFDCPACFREGCVKATRHYDTIYLKCDICSRGYCGIVAEPYTSTLDIYAFWLDEQNDLDANIARDALEEAGVDQETMSKARLPINLDVSGMTFPIVDNTILNATRGTIYSVYNNDAVRRIANRRVPDN